MKSQITVDSPQLHDISSKAGIRFTVLCIILFLFCTGAVAQDMHQGSTLSVMTYNIHHGNPPGTVEGTIDMKAIAKTINQAKPDLVALQEVDVNNSRSGLTLNEARELGRLTGMHYYFTRAIDFSSGFYGDAVLSRFKILDSLRYELPITMSMKGETRSVCLIKIQLPEKKTILFASTHLDHLKRNDNRLLQAKVLSNIIRSFPLPLIIGGDFNAKPNSPAMNELSQVLSRTCTAENCPYTFSAQNPNRTLDHILYAPSDAFKVKEVKAITGASASDHLPLTVAFEVK